MNPTFLDSMSWEMAEVYGAITDQILINLAKYFPYFDKDKLPGTSFAYQAKMLAQMGQVNRETIQIIKNGLKDANAALNGVLEQSIINAVWKTEPSLARAVKAGILKPAGIPKVSPNQYQAFNLYYQQAAQKLNLVNTVMLESTKQAYQTTVSDIVSRVQATQTALDIGTGEVVTGVSSWNQAAKHAIDRMKGNGITGFIDHAGHKWSAESYVAMDIRTTVYNTGRSAVWEMNQDFGNDLYIVSYHDGARPLCYDWQNKVISSTDNARTVQDLDGNEILVYRQSDTSYGQPAGLFGINCKHYPSPFIPGVSVTYDQSRIQDPEDNKEVYEQTQQQRALERKLREQKRDVLMEKARGATEEQLREMRDKVKDTSKEIDDFCAKTGLPRRTNREGVYTKRDFPDASTYDVTAFERSQKETIDKYFSGGGAQQNYTAGTMTPKAPIVPTTPTPVVPVAPATPVVPVAPAPATPAVAPTAQQNPQESELFKRLKNSGIAPLEVKRLDKPLTTDEIIEKISGADKTKGSCASVGLTYCANKAGLDVTDFRGGTSQFMFSRIDVLKQIANLDGIDGIVQKGYNDFTNAHELLKNVADGKEYFFTAGKHAAIVRKSATGIEYLEMQSGWRKNTWYDLTDEVLRYRFGCQRSHTTYGMKYETSEVFFEVDKVKGNSVFEAIMRFINTAADQQRKGIGGGEK